MIVNFIDNLRQRLPLLIRVGLVLLAALLLWDVLLLDKSKAHTAMEGWPAFWALFGFAAAGLIIVVAKIIGSLGLQVKEDFYDQDC